MSFHFGVHSLARLSTCDHKLQGLMRRAIAITPVDFAILCGARDRAAQDEAYRNGLSKVKWPNSKHNESPSRAVDIAPWPIDWNDRPMFCVLAGVIMTAAELEKIDIRWGGDWDSDNSTRDQSFMDLGHFELA